MPPDTILYDIAEQMLEKVAEYLESVDIFVPERRYVHVGDPALDIVTEGDSEDCVSMFVVTYNPQQYVGNPGEEFGDVDLKCEVPRTAQYEIWMIRCAPGLHDDGTAPTNEELSASALEICADAREISNAVYKLHKAKELVPVKDGVVGLGSSRPYGPEGGAGGTIQEVTVGLV